MTGILGRAQWLRCALLLATLAGLMGCTHKRSGGEGIASLSPAITQTLIALDLVDELVARSDYDRDPRVAALPAVGTALSPNIEALARLAPEVIISDTSGGHETQLEPLAEVISLGWSTPEALRASILELGNRFDRRQEAAELESSVEAALLPRPLEDCPTVLLVLRSQDVQQIWYLPRNSLHGHLVPSAGGCHAIDRDIMGAAVLGPEQLLRINPDIIVMLAAGTPGQESTDDPFSALPGLSAVRNDRIIILHGEDLLIPGPSIVSVAKRLRDAVRSVWRPSA